MIRAHLRIEGIPHHRVSVATWDVGMPATSGHTRPTSGEGEDVTPRLDEAEARIIYPGSL
jgi:hypothetical protein